MSKLKNYIILLAVVLSCLPEMIIGQTFVSGSVNGIWDVEGSPYIVIGGVAVDYSQSLTIEPGVEVLFQGNYKIVVTGLLTTVGTETDSILFSWYEANPANRGRGLIFINANDASQVSYCIIEHMYISFSNDEWAALACDECSPTFSHNTIRENTHLMNGINRTGAGIFCEQSGSLVEYNEVYNNFGRYGSGIGLHYYNGICQNNYVHHNTADGNGAGGIQLTYCDPPCEVRNNTIVYNHSNIDGGGMFLLYGSTASVHHNVIAFNTCGHSGAAIAFHSGSNAPVYNNTIFGNNASYSYNAFYNYSSSSSAVFYNNIVWDVDANEIDPDFQNVTFNDVLGGYWGFGNINADPLLVDPDELDFTLQPESPCINAGDPSITDPDGTFSDMGAFYYPSTPGMGIVTIEFTPVNPPINLPPFGGTVAFDVEITCEEDYTVFDGWYDLELPDGQVFSPVLLKESLYLAPGSSINGELELEIPALAMPGTYEVQGYVGSYPDSVVSMTFLTFTKESSGDMYAAGSNRTGSISWLGDTEYFELPAVAPISHKLTLSASPNPFNPETNISFILPDAGSVNLQVFDIAGREIAELHSGILPPGLHEFRWNAEDYSSGVYFVTCRYGNRLATHKITLIK